MLYYSIEINKAYEQPSPIPIFSKDTKPKRKTASKTTAQTAFIATGFGIALGGFGKKNNNTVYCFH